MTLIERVIFLMLAASLSLVVWFRLRRVSAPIAVIVSSLWIAAAIAAPAYSFGLYNGHPDALPYVDGLGTWCVYRHCALIDYIGWPYAALGMQLAVAAIAAVVYVWPRKRRWLAGSMTVLFALSMILVGNGLERVVR